MCPDGNRRRTPRTILRLAEMSETLRHQTRVVPACPGGSWPIAPPQLADRKMQRIRQTLGVGQFAPTPVSLLRPEGHDAERCQRLAGEMNETPPQRCTPGICDAYQEGVKHTVRRAAGVETLTSANNEVPQAGPRQPNRPVPNPMRTVLWGERKKPPPKKKYMELEEVFAADVDLTGYEKNNCWRHRMLEGSIDATLQGKRRD